MSAAAGGDEDRVEQQQPAPAGFPAQDEPAVQDRIVERDRPEADDSPADSPAERAERAERTERAGRTERLERGEQDPSAERPGQTEQTEQAGPEALDSPAEPDRQDKQARQAHQDQRPEPDQRTEQAEQAEQAEPAEQAVPHQRAERAEQTEQTVPDQQAEPAGPDQQAEQTEQAVPDQQAEQTEQAVPEQQVERPADPEQALAAVRWRLNPETLREEAPEPEALREIRDGLTAKLGSALDNRSRARLLSLRSVASRVLGDLDDALADARLAHTYAEATGELRRTALVRARLAEVLRWRGEYAEADRLFASANSPELPDRLRAVLHEHAGRCCYDQGRLTEACLHFERALDLRHGDDAELNARTALALDAVAERAVTAGFGPKPRSREVVLGEERYPVPTLDEEQQLWGYADAEGNLVVEHRYAEVQPFREGMAWVRRPEASRWALIDATGAALIEANNGYRAVGSFAEGLAWVSMDGKGRWMAVDPTNIVKIPPGYEDVRPFRGGLAAVRQNGGWGAVDRTGQVVVPTRYHGLSTALADGRYVDGFTEEGLAGVELAGRRGVVDRTGRVLVVPAYPALVVHPVAFLVSDDSGRWGALDRRGEPLIDPVHPSQAAVVAEIDQLLADTSPVL
ncbi:WG repeat-containing protein [Micromonospora sp. HK10]|uniref:WG repeat-containing protein n=1 Tax=Micromonospora sp. HK10 TaxID=1538294 RepID=UPI000AD4F013|nr:WG repeat-containing protein [Micromonospora sp. HK10]